MATITPQVGASVSASTPPPHPFVAKWDVKEKTYRLFIEANRFALDDGSKDRAITFKPTLYDIGYAVALFSMFRQTIGVNLERERPNSACFLPKLCLKAHQDPEVQVALFGYVDTKTNARGELKWSRWGLFHSGTKQEQTFEVDADDVAKVFLLNAPTTNRADLVEKTDQYGKTVTKPGPKHYAMDNYAKSFSAVLIKDQTNQIQKVALRVVSQIDRNVSLTEEKWAVTLVSALSSDGSLFGRSFGHAMLACEGVVKGIPFLRYIHFLQEPHEKLPGLKGDEAQVESFEPKNPLQTMNGPTFLRPKAFVENMFREASKMEQKRYKFALYGNFFSHPILSWISFKNSFLNITSNEEMLGELAELDESPWTCLSIAMQIAEYAGIIFQRTKSLRTPLEKIQMLKEGAPVYQIPNGFDRRRLGQPFPGNSQVANKILDACVVLVPEDAPLEDLNKWSMQTIIEDTAATDREIARLNAATSLSEVWELRYKPKSW